MKYIPPAGYKCVGRLESPTTTVVFLLPSLNILLGSICIYCTYDGVRLHKRFRALLQKTRGPSSTSSAASLAALHRRKLFRCRRHPISHSTGHMEAAAWPLCTFCKERVSRRPPSREWRSNITCRTLPIWWARSQLSRKCGRNTRTITLAKVWLQAISCRADYLIARPSCYTQYQLQQLHLLKSYNRTPSTPTPRFHGVHPSL